MSRPQPDASRPACRACRRALRWNRREHRCYGAVHQHRGDSVTWVVCGCDCQRTLASLGFFDLDGQPSVEVVPTAPPQHPERTVEPGSPAAR